MKSIDVMKCKLVREAQLPYSGVRTSENAADIFREFGMADSPDELVAMACLSVTGSIVGIHEISHGDLSASIIHPREIFKRAMLNNAASIILAHNHPSGNLEPSYEDKEMTKRLKNAGELLGIPLVDHIILSGEGYYSFKNHDLL